MADYKPSAVTGLVNVSGSVDLSRLDIIEHTVTTSVAVSTLTTIFTHTAAAKENIE